MNDLWMSLMGIRAGLIFLRSVAKPVSKIKHQYQPKTILLTACIQVRPQHGRPSDVHMFGRLACGRLICAGGTDGSHASSAYGSSSWANGYTCSMHSVVCQGRRPPACGCNRWLARETYPSVYSLASAMYHVRSNGLAFFCATSRFPVGVSCYVRPHISVGGWGVLHMFIVFVYMLSVGQIPSLMTHGRSCV